MSLSIDDGQGHCQKAWVAQASRAYQCYAICVAALPVAAMLHAGFFFAFPAPATPLPQAFARHCVSGDMSWICAGRCVVEDVSVRFQM